MIDVARIQASLTREGIGAWLLYDFRGINPIAQEVLRIHPGNILTRRWFYKIPARGEPVGLHHVIEPDAVSHLPGRKIAYGNRNVLREELSSLLSGFDTVAMEYSPNAALPTLSMVDRGTIELVESLGSRVVPSANLVQDFLAVLSEDQYGSHLRAVDRLMTTKDKVFARVADKLRAGEQVDEFQIQQFILERFRSHRLVSDHDPIVAVNAHAGQPHYEPTEQRHSAIKEGDLLLIDLWAREPGGVFADITWTGFVGETVPDKFARVFDIVRRARDAAIAVISDAYAAGRTITGADADRAARGVITEAGYGERFIHRTGPSITSALPGPGANLDDLETEDVRPLVPGLLFSVEPGIYLDDFGIRSEVNVFITPEGPRVTTQPLQAEILPLLAR